MAIREPEITAGGVFDCEGAPVLGLDAEGYLAQAQPLSEQSLREIEEDLGHCWISAASDIQFARRDLALWANGEFRKPLTVREMHAIISYFAATRMRDDRRELYGEA